MTAITAWAEESDGWDLETGDPGIGLFANAVQVWASMQERPVTVNDVALAFLCQPERVREAVEWHGWMYLRGDLIEHDGE